MAAHSSILAWKIPWTEEPGRLQSMGLLRVGSTEQLYFHFSLSCIGEGNGNPLQCSCLENPRDRGAWWAAVSGVAQSQTRLKRFSSSSSSSEAWRAAVHGVTKSRTRLNDWTELLDFTNQKFSYTYNSQSCTTFCNPMDCGPPSSSVHGILQARILKWVAIPFSRGPSQPRDRTWVSCIAGGFFIAEPPGKPP